MFARHQAILAAVFTVCLSSPLLAQPETACNRILEDKAYCDGCGFSFCNCVGSVCPSAKITCNSTTSLQLFWGTSIYNTIPPIVTGGPSAGLRIQACHVTI